MVSARHRFTHLIGVSLLVVSVLVVSPDSAHAGAGDFSYSTGSGTAQDWSGFGDSILAGYCGLFCSVKSYGSYYADYAAAENDWAVNLQARPQSGETTIQIYDEMNIHIDELRNADLVLWSAGGNDFLGARDDYKSTCNEAGLNQALQDWRADWDLIISLVSAEAAPEAMIRTMNVYYPDPDRDRASFCGSVSDFEVFYPLLLDAGDYMCTTAALAGFQCADSIAAMNCDEVDANHTIDPNCLDPSGDNFRDPLAAIKYVDGVATSWPNASNSGMIQSDRTHPGSVGHQYIARAHHELGYEDAPTSSFCGDAVCDIGEDAATCPSDCPDVCGDGLCTGSEDAATCGSDCPDVCGDGLCTGPEDTTDCPADCGTLCGDGVCNGSETDVDCPDDCAVACIADGDGLGCDNSTPCCSGVGNCTGGKPANRVCATAPSVCGDGVVEGGEDCEGGVPLADSCETLGFSSGTLACETASCSYDTSGCSGGTTCGGNKAVCSVNSDCCSNRCQGGACKGN